MNSEYKDLTCLKPGEEARMVALLNHPIAERLRDLGFLPGTWVRVLFEAPIWGDPIAVEVRGTRVALRKSEAGAIKVDAATTRVFDINVIG